MANVERKAKIEEAVKRLTMIGMLDDVVEGIRDGNVWESELCGILYNIPLNASKGNKYDKMLNEIAKFEDEYNALVYHVICDATGMTSYLYVSDYADEWDYDHEDLKAGFPLAYVKGFCDEFGSIGIAQQYGGLVRTA